MSGTLGDVFDHLIKVIFLMLAVFIIMWGALYWLTWTIGKQCIDRAMTEVQVEMRKEGTISESFVTQSVEKFCTSSAYTGFDIIEIKPGFDTLPQYLGQPMYLEVVVTYHIFLKDIKIAGRADIGNSGHYGKGYNTKNEIS